MSKASTQTLRVLRSLLRHARDTTATCPVAIAAAASHSASTGSDVAGSLPLASADGSWSKFILNQYRANQHLTKRGDIKNARASAIDILAYVEALREQDRLQGMYKGADVDAPSQRRDVARFVGFDMPSVPNALDANEITGKVADKYSESLSAKTDVGKLTGVDSLKAQLYGISSITPTLDAAATDKIRATREAYAARSAAAAAARAAAKTGTDV